MGLYYTAKLVLGVSFDENLTTRKETVRGCNHNLPEDAKFCPTCGAPRLKKVNVEPKRLELDDYYDLLEEKGILDETIELPGNIIRRVIGFGFSMERDEFAKIDLFTAEQIEEKKEYLRSKLEPMGLWDESTFGYHLLHIGR